MRMIVIQGSAGLVAPDGSAVTVGNFDGVHLGHQELLRRTVARARGTGRMAVALTFSPHPVRFFSPGARFYEITGPREKAELIAASGIDALVVESFGGDVGRMTPEEFAGEILVRRLAARDVVVGYDFTFGRSRTGSPARLAELGRSMGFEVEIVPPVRLGGSVVSSTRIRELLLAGRVREAEELMRRPYRLSGRVVRGADRGRRLGFPTANVDVVEDLIPLPGVYVVEAEVSEVRRLAVANVGFTPTFGENSLGIEVHILDFDESLYGREIAVHFRERIRDERKFNSADELVRQIRKDVRYAREFRRPAGPKPAGRKPNAASAGESS